MDKVILIYKKRDTSSSHLHLQHRNRDHPSVQQRKILDWRHQVRSKCQYLILH